MAFEASAFLGLPSPSLFKFPPGSEPSFVTPPPPASLASAPPFDIPNHIYQAVLDPRVPITIAVVYAITAKLCNVYNKSTNKKPWAISKYRVFDWFVIAHNVFLAVYSMWTWWGMFNGLRRTMVSPLGPDGLAGYIDSVCQVIGPKGLGNSLFFDEKTQSWFSYNPDVALSTDGTPSAFDTGRMWNEGLAFYGWLFYLSKFYEVLDTFIILAKGKYSSTLQTYHHAGAMMCMWAGMRYMSAPIWLFVFFNSFIHSIMYTYFTVTAFRIRVPLAFKRLLTSLQITQFIVGGSYAMIHSFVSYTIPVAASSSETEAAATASAAVNGSATPILHNDAKIAYTGRKEVPCVTTTGGTFAVWLNVVYLAPLTYLFVSFFIESYLRRSKADKKVSAIKGVDDRRMSNSVIMAEKAGWEAAQKTNREVYGESNEEAIVEDVAAPRVSLRGKPAPKAANGRALRNRQ
ncbi:fatty acid elongase-like protein [Bombardia bombarda]|uniref:Elongation of fatty acids protein n=1 Tax=Bombardia bombarda TaxID=252184 RepID=A0AA39WTK7_9PEZI|nr:fatty acid elongase-like protein [Bombardia bombarda]